jgi:hypothetical protein
MNHDVTVDRHPVHEQVPVSRKVSLHPVAGGADFTSCIYEQDRIDIPIPLLSYCAKSARDSAAAKASRARK